MQTWGVLSFASNGLFCVVLSPPSIFKKIFCKGEPLGHQLQARTVTSCPAGLAGGYGGLGVGEVGRCFSPLVPPEAGSQELGDQGLPCRGWDPLSWHPEHCLDEAHWELTGECLS